MSISILGAGNVGLALARALLRASRPVTLGVPEPARYAQAVAALGPQATLTDSDDAVQRAELVVLAVPYAAALAIAQRRADWQGRVLVDATKPLAPGLAGLSLGTTTSGAEQVLALATLIGFDAVDMGPLAAARHLEPLAMVWIHLAFKQGQGRRFAFARLARA